jgi:hypothetical protein
MIIIIFTAVETSNLTLVKFVYKEEIRDLYYSVNIIGRNKSCRMIDGHVVCMGMMRKSSTL